MPCPLIHSGTWIFGEDITAWSVPHLILLTSFVLTQLLALCLQVSTIPLEGWRNVFGLRLKDMFSLLILAAISLLWLQLMLIDWDATLTGIKLEWLGLYRPEWLLAANLLASVTLTGVIATRVLRCAGAATATGLLALAIRYGLIQLFQADMLQYVAWIAALLPLLAIDIWSYYCSAIRNREPEWRGTAFAVMAGMALNAAIIRGLYRLEAGDNLAYALAVIFTGIGMSWLSHQLAEAMLKRRTLDGGETNEVGAMNPQVSIGIVGAFVAFIIVFIVTATPPV